MKRRVHFDLGTNLRGGKRLAQFVLRVRLTRIVVRGDAEIHARLDLRCEQMRAVRFGGDEVSTVERRARTDAVRNRRGSPDYERPAHAVALRADFLCLVNLRLAVEEGD